MIFILINKINLEFLGLKLALKLIILYECVRELFLTKVALCTWEEFFNDIRVYLPLQYLFNVRGIIFGANKAGMSPLRFHNLIRQYLMQFLPSEVITLVLNFREHVSELSLPGRDLFTRLLSEVLLDLSERLYLVLVQTWQIKHLHALDHLLKLNIH